MGKKDSGVDAYIAQSAEFARPILNHLRRVVHAGCPDVEETIKWGFPHFEYQGILCSMAAFKAHCAFGFWKGSLLAGGGKAPTEVSDAAMGQFGRITSLLDLPPEKKLLQLVRKAARLNAEGVKLPRRPKARSSRGLEAPAYFMSALRRNKKALATYRGFSPCNKRDYVEWLTEAKREDTRKRRLETAVAWLAQGKVRNWKYVRK